MALTDSKVRAEAYGEAPYKQKWTARGSMFWFRQRL